MRRFFALLLICLLPLHVFAKVVHIDASVKAVTQTAPMSVDSFYDIEQDISAIHALFYGDHSQSGTDTSDLSHFSALDEPVIYSTLVFLPDASISFTAGKSDRAIQPPFLSPDGRPPRA